MAFDNTYTAVTGATYTAANYNKYTRDNLNAVWVYTTAGDIAYAASATALSRLAIGSTGDVLTVVAGAPAWAPSVPIGVVMAWSGSAVPTNWLNCDGALVSKATYAALYAILGTIWGAGDANNFNLPDLRGRTIIGVGTGSGLTARALAASVGEENHALTAAENGAHTHAYQFPTFANLTANASEWYAIRNDTSTASTSGSSGSGTAHNTMQPSRALYQIIKAL